MSRTFWNLLAAVVLSGNVLAQPVIIPAPPLIAADSWILQDAKSGKIIVEHNADKPVPPASLTKMMTSYVLSFELAQGTVSNNDSVVISKNAWAQNPVFKGSSLMWIEVGKKVTLGDLHRGIVVSSGNDASVAIAEYLAGSQAAFTDIMNQHALALGMKNTLFANPHGLPAETHYTTSRDLALLVKGLLRYPETYALYKEKQFTYNNITQSNRNRLLWTDPSVDGVKTGHTDEAGYCLVSSAERDGMRLIAVVMGAKSQATRERESQKLLSYGYRYFETHQLYRAGTELQVAKVWKGAQDVVSLGITEDAWLTIPRGSHGKLDARLVIDDTLMAPLEKGREYGELVVSLEGDVLLKKPLVALEAVDKGSIVKRLWHSIVLFVLNLIQ